jgi:hypothetical protein
MARAASYSTPAQRTAIKALWAALSGDDAVYRERLKNQFGADSCTKLSKAQAGVFIDDLRQQLGQAPVRVATPRKRATGKNVVRLASAAQHEKISALRSLIEWKLSDGYQRWLSARFSMKRVKTAQEAWQVIEGLKKMFEHQMKALYGNDWMDLVHEDPEIGRYIDEHITG